MADDLEDLDEAVRRHDPDRWLASRFIDDPSGRADVIALYAFNHEISRVAGAVTNPIMGEIRLTWWSEAIAEIFEGRAVRKHPVTLPLKRAIEAHGLARAPFDAMIEARFPELDGLPVDVDASEGALMKLAADVLGGGSIDAIAQAARVYAGQGDRAEANRLLRHLPAAAFPAVAYACLSGLQDASPLRRRLALTWAVLRGRI